MILKIENTELKEHFDEQVKLILNGIKSFDLWNIEEAKNLVMRLRLFLHEWTWESLLKQIWVKDRLKYYDSSLDRIENPMVQIEFSPYAGLIQFVVWNDKVFAILDWNPKAKRISFDDRWNGTIFIDTNWTKFSRKDIVIDMANKDGWWHITLNLNEEYRNITRNWSIGIQIRDDENWYKSVKKLEYIAIRQITHELLKSMFHEYKFNYTFNGNWYFMCIV